MNRLKIYPMILSKCQLVNMNRIYIIAEMSANHMRDKKVAINTIKEIAKTGADAVKVQTFKPESITLNSKFGFFGPRKDGLWKGKTPWDLYSHAALPYEWHKELKDIANNNGIDFFSSPFDIESVDLLESLDVQMYKIASLEINHLPLIDYVASKGKPILISTGVANITDIKNAIDVCKKNKNNQITLLKCTSDYPAEISKANLATLTDMKSRFRCDIGISDHTIGYTVPLAAVSYGIRIIEKHFTIDKKLGGLDASFSMEPTEFKKMVKKIREAEDAVGSIDYSVSNKDKMRRRSIFCSEKILKGDLITQKNVRVVRPGNGLSPKYYYEILGKRVNQNLNKGEPFKLKYIKE